RERAGGGGLVERPGPAGDGAAAVRGARPRPVAVARARAPAGGRERAAAREAARRSDGALPGAPRRGGQLRVGARARLDLPARRGGLGAAGAPPRRRRPALAGAARPRAGPRHALADGLAALWA